MKESVDLIPSISGRKWKYPILEMDDATGFFLEGKRPHDLRGHLFHWRRALKRRKLPWRLICVLGRQEGKLGTFVLRDDTGKVVRLRKPRAGGHAHKPRLTLLAPTVTQTGV